MHENRAGIRVSVCIPTYNGADFLHEAIRSVLTQSFRDFELLIVDDGSSDATLDIARSFSDARLRIVQNETRLGIPANWNRAVSLTQGEFLYLFHQDDVMLPENLARKVTLLSENPTVSFVHSAIEFLVEEDAPTPPANWVEDATTDFIIEGESYFSRLLFKNCICAPTVLMRRAHFNRIGAFAATLGFTCDYAMWLQLCLEGDVAFCSQPLVLYRWHKKNATHDFRFENGAEEFLAARQSALRYYEERIPEREKAEIFHHAVRALAEAERRAVGFDHESERRLAYIKELEVLRDKLGADVQQLKKGWDEQQAYIKELEALRDKLWAEVQHVGKSWEEQRAYIKEQQSYIQKLEEECERWASRPLRRLGRKALGRSAD